MIIASQKQMVSLLIDFLSDLLNFPGALLRLKNCVEKTRSKIKGISVAIRRGRIEEELRNKEYNYVQNVCKLFSCSLASGRLVKSRQQRNAVGQCWKSHD